MIVYKHLNRSLCTLKMYFCRQQENNPLFSVILLMQGWLRTGRVWSVTKTMDDYMPINIFFFFGESASSALIPFGPRGTVYWLICRAVGNIPTPPMDDSTSSIRKCITFGVSVHLVTAKNNNKFIFFRHGFLYN